jgi:hypothetical protein
MAQTTFDHDRRTKAAAWIGLLGPPVAWAMQLVVGNAFAEVGCDAGGFSGITVLLIVITIVAAAVAILTSVIGWRSRDGSGDGAVSERAGFMAVGAAISGIVFTTLILVGGLLPHLFLPTCGA